jgi:hypothetical protein
MAFNKYAKAGIVKPAISMDAWDEVRAKASSLGSPFDTKKASKVVLQKYRPDQFLLSHCTIIASVDTEVSVEPLGPQIVDGFQIDRKYADYLVSPATTKYVNNNNDCWERKLLLACFRTFIGGENYVEHLQIPELSKGKIVDAAARDIGESVYVDILVATDLKHKPLVEAITSKQIQTLSMGCQVSFTTCTKCGNVAEDETQLCPHIRYMKGNSFIDHLGKVRKIAELCGHIQAEPGSVKFIEASWVANPAFTGAVLRNILSVEEAQAYGGHKLQAAFSMPPRVADPNKRQKAANQGQGEGFGFEDQDTAPAKEEDPLSKAVDELAGILKDRALAKVRGEMSGPEAPRSDMAENRNDTLTHQASACVRSAIILSPQWKKIARTVANSFSDPDRTKKVLWGLLLYKNGGWKNLRGFNGEEILMVSQFVDRLSGVTKVAGEERIYRTISQVGGIAPYSDVESYLSACRRVMGRTPTTNERDALIAKGRLFDLGSS